MFSFVSIRGMQLWWSANLLQEVHKNWSTINPKSTKMVVGTKTAQNRPRGAPKSSQDPPSWKSKSSRIGPKKPLGEVLGDLGPKMAPRGLQQRKCIKNLNISTPLLWAKILNKSIQNRSRKLSIFVMIFWWIFGGFWEPKNYQKPIKNRSKRHPKTYLILASIFDSFLLNF